MANISVTNTFINTLTELAAPVNRNFSDIINGLTDGTKDLSVNNIIITNDLTASAALSASIIRSVANGITASATQTQAGGYAITKDYNEISISATAGNAVTLPTAVAGMEIYIVNNGANEIKIFPASGASISTGAANASLTASTNAKIVFRAITSLLWYYSVEAAL